MDINALVSISGMLFICAAVFSAGAFYLDKCSRDDAIVAQIVVGFGYILVSFILAMLITFPLSGHIQHIIDMLKNSILFVLFVVGAKLVASGIVHLLSLNKKSTLLTVSGLALLLFGQLTHPGFYVELNKLNYFLLSQVSYFFCALGAGFLALRLEAGYNTTPMK